MINSASPGQRTNQRDLYDASHRRGTLHCVRDTICVLRAYARTPVNGKLPIGLMVISPVIMSPSTLPANSSVSGIGLVIETFQATSASLAVSWKISAESHLGHLVPVSVGPDE